MKKIDVLGKVLHFDAERNVLTYKLNFVTPEVHKEIENLIEYPYFVKDSTIQLFTLHPPTLQFYHR